MIMAALNIFLILSLICLGFYFAGVINYLTGFEDNSCRMTYMYEYPQFIKIDVPDGFRFNRYTLYAYSEGRLTEKSRNMYFDGIPVLFIPGNAGSYKQVRSLASVSLRKYLNSRTRFHFDYFTVDLNEEYSGLFGGVLEAQSQFVNISINAILNLYDKHSSHPESVVVVGHSMGGIIAQNLLTIPDNVKRINTIITLATPNKNPIATLDHLIPAFYARTYNHWKKNRLHTITKDTVQSNQIKSTQINNIQSSAEKNSTADEKNDISKILLISIGGGVRDILVPSGLTGSKFSNIDILTTSIPKVWLSTDHQCIVWCLQLVLVLNRCLFNMVDNRTKQISTNLETRFNAAAKLLMTTHEPAHSKRIHFNPDASWMEDNRRVFSVRFMKGVNATRYQMIRLLDSHLHQMLAVEVLNLDDDDWIFGCAAIHISGQSRVCHDGLSLSNHTRPLPSVRYSRRIVYMDLHKLKRKNPSWTHVIFRLSPTNEPVQLNFDVYNRDERLLKTSAPRLVSLTSSEVLSETPSNAVHYDMTISGFTSIYQALHLDVKSLECSAKTYHVVATMFVPWMPGDSSVHYFTESQTDPMPLRLHQTHLPLHTTSNNVRIRFVLDANCKYAISLRSSFVDSLGQLARHYSLNILPYMASILILALRQQILQVRIDGQCSNLLTAMTIGAKPYYVVTIAKIAQKFVSSDPGMPMLLPLLSFAVAWALVWIIGLVTYAGIAFAGKIVHFLILRIISMGFSGWAMNGLQKLPIAVGVFLIAMGAATCGALTLFATALFYSILLSKMYEDYMDTIVFNTVKKVAKKILSKTIAPENTEANNETVSNPSTCKNELNVKNSDNVESTDSSKSLNELKDKAGFSNVDCAGDHITGQETEQKTDLNVNETNQENISAPENTSANNNTGRIRGLINKLLNKAVDIILPESDITLSVIHFHLTIFLILMFTAFLNAPSLLTWSNNFKYNPSLEPDPSFITAAVMGICISAIWQMEVPKINLLYSVELGYILYVLAAGTLIFSTVALYTINYFLSCVLILLAVHQCMPNFGFKEHVANVENETQNSDSRKQTSVSGEKEKLDDQKLNSKYKIMKTKLQEDS